MRTIYFDCFAGISGDMTLGALVDAGADGEKVISALATLPVSGFELRWERAESKGISATRAVVAAEEGHHHRDLAKILEIIGSSGIGAGAKSTAENIFKRLAEAEAGVHGVPVDQVRFHEVGAVDAIVDIVGAAVAVDLLGAELCIGSPVRTGFGTVRCAHGEYPIPAPGTAALLKGVPAYAGQFEGEWTTPTGAAILTTLCRRFEPLPPMRCERIGYGAGSRRHETLPNLLRVFVGELTEEQANEVTVIEAQIDDMSPEIAGHLQDRLREAGALDCYVTPVQMKKNRPGFLLTVICRPELRPALADLLFRESTTIGYRFYSAGREELERSIEEVDTPYGTIGVKVARRGGRVVNASPEYEDCLRAAEAAGVPLKMVRDAAAGAYAVRRNSEDTEIDKGGEDGQT